MAKIQEIPTFKVEKKFHSLRPNCGSTVTKRTSSCFWRRLNFHNFDTRINFNDTVPNFHAETYVLSVQNKNTAKFYRKF